MITYSGEYNEDTHTPSLTITRDDLVKRGLVLLVDLVLVLVPTLVAIGLRAQIIPFGRDLNGRPHFTNDNLRRLDEITAGFSRAHTVGDTMIALSGTSLAICVAVFLVVAFFVYHFTPTVASGATPAELIINRYTSTAEENSTTSYLETVVNSEALPPSKVEPDDRSESETGQPPLELALVALPELKTGSADPIEISLTGDATTVTAVDTADEDQDESIDQRLHARPLPAADQATSSEIILATLPSEKASRANKPPLPLPRALRDPSPRHRAR